MTRRPIVLIHGYSDEGTSFEKWEEILEAKGYDVTTIHTCTYRSLTNEVTIKDIAEGFDRALKIRAGLDNGEPFDAIVHSTGMLVVRAWLVAYGKRKRRLKHLIGLAPATFGSPLAHKGRSWLGSIFKGNREVGPDFLEAGDRILDGLELGSRFTWELAHQDLLGEDTFYGPTKSTPYPFILCGTKAYGGLRRLVNEPGTDGTVRWAGCSLNSRKVVFDLTNGEKPSTVSLAHVSVVDDIPLIPIDGINHSTILSAPTPLLIELVERALHVQNEQEFRAWQAHARRVTKRAADKLAKWQQFVVRAVDERGDPISDYHVQLVSKTRSEKVIDAFDTDVHAYAADKSFRCFHVNIDKVHALPSLWVRLMASSGSQLVAYHGVGSEKYNPDTQRIDQRGKWDAEVDLSHLLRSADFQFFYPYTTTLIELRIDREPLPLTGINQVCFFPDRA